MGKMNTARNYGNRNLRRTSLAIGLGLCFASAGAFAQSTTGNIVGQVPVAAGESVSISGSTGITRETSVDKAGRYSFTNLPLGSYTVNLKKDGAIVDKRENVQLTVSASTTVSFVSPNAQNLATVTVKGNALPPIDVNSVDSRSVITAKQLAQLPLGRSAESIATLAPGVIAGSRDFGNAVSFGGSSVSENAYYINGFNTTDPLKSIGGSGLPYGSIEQQETYTGGYSAKYGRSDGGVLNQVGKRGTNDWHFGGQVTWAPTFASANPTDTYYPNNTLPAGYAYTDDTVPGTIYRRRDNNKSWDTTYSGYVSGPLIQDKLFFFLSAEVEKQQGVSTPAIDASIQANNHYKYSDPKVYAKIDWNITDSNILELTDISTKESYAGDYYDYDYDTGKQGNTVTGHPTSHKYAHDFYIAQYTSYITDDLTFSATYGKNKTTDYQTTPGLSDTLPYLSGTTLQDPAINGGAPIRNGVPTYSTTSPSAGSTTHGLRADLSYHLGDHQLSVGIDNMKYNAQDEGHAMGGPGYAWVYGKESDPTAPINSGLGVGAAGGNGYYVRNFIFSTLTSASLSQKAQYLEDRWQINDRLLLSLGIRNDEFKNYNNVGQVFVDEKNQWAPRLGFSWDVMGDSSLKVFGNLGRYYLALPSAVAIRGGSASTYTNEYFTYSGIDANGNPTGLKGLGPGPVSADGETGDTPNAKSVSPTNLKAEYQDEAIFGVTKALGPDWVAGAKVSVRKLQSAIDDVCDEGKIFDKLAANGVDLSTVKVSASGDLSPSCKLFNPGETNTYNIENTSGGFYKVDMSKSDWGFTEGAKRKYYALDLFLEHPFDGKWQGRLDYTFSRSYGNTEGQVRSDLDGGQDDVSKTQDWDFAELMIGSNGVLPNDRKHQLKAYGAYQVTPEWLVSGRVQLISGTPKSCIGYFPGPDGANAGDGTDPDGYGSAYRFCNGKLSPPGSAGRTPWLRQLDLGITYSPAFADHKLAFKLDIFNVTNEQKATLVNTTYEDTPGSVSNSYGIAAYYQAPRYARLSASYDF